MYAIESKPINATNLKVNAHQFQYVDKYNVEHTGALQQIGDDLIVDQGDWRLQGNQEPWYDIDDMGNVTDREFTLKEWIEWVARFEDRPTSHVQRSLRTLHFN